MAVKVLAFCGSSRRNSLNQKLLDVAVLGARDAGGMASTIRLVDLRLPIYDGDWEAEQGLAEGARLLKELIADHDGLLVATPEHNGGCTALLKNALDWASRPSTIDQSGLGVFAGKVAAVVSASPGAMGGMRSQIVTQISLNKLGVMVIPNAFALSMAHKAFDDTGHLIDGNAEKLVRAVGAALVHVTSRVVRSTQRAAQEDAS